VPGIRVHVRNRGADEEVHDVRLADHRARTRPEPQSGLLAWEFDQRTENSPREGRTVRTALVRT
jgi:hypothetical protein